MASMDMNDGPRGGRGGRGAGFGYGNRGRGRGRGGGRDYQSGGGYQGGSGGGYQQDYNGGGGARGYQGGGGRQQGRNSWQQQQQQQQSVGDGGSGRRGRGYWGNTSGPPRGGRSRGRGRGRGRDIRDPEDIQFLKALKGHEAQVTAAVLDAASNQLYTGSQDGTVRVWSCETGECKSKVDVGGVVDMVLLEGGYLFVGMHIGKANGLVKVWNTASGAEQALPGPQGQILSLLAVNGMLFSGSNDNSIHVWKHDAATGQFEPAVALTSASGGHTTPVQAMAVVNQFMFTADWGGTIKVWDLAAGACVQTLEGAHDSVIMGLVNWQGHLVSCSLDGLVKIWQPVETPAPSAVLDTAPVYVHPPEEANSQSQQFGGVLAIAGTLDGQQKPVLLASHNEDHVVRLWELPTFAERGELSAVHDARALTAGGAGLIVTGDKHGTVKVWQWKQ